MISQYNKSKAIKLIKTKGNCAGIACPDCIIQSYCYKKKLNLSLKQRYNLAIKKYIELYGEEDLMEELL